MPQSWTLAGNSVSAADLFGTTNARPLKIHTNGKEQVTVRPNGNVGIGHTSPATKLHVTGKRVRLEFEGKRLDLRADGAAVDVQSFTHTVYLHSSGPTGRNHVVINPFRNQGNVGVGTQTPETKLHVVGNRLRLESAGKQLDLRADGEAVDVQSATHSVYLHSSGPAGRNHVVINPFPGQGNVGIGTQIPTERLHVEGKIRANDVIIVSDARAKSRITPFTGAVGKLQGLQAVAFDWALDEECGGQRERSVGVLAQDVESVMPELVQTPESGGYKGVNYPGLTAVLVQAVKELAEQNRTLKVRVEAMERALGHGA